MKFLIADTFTDSLAKLTAEEQKAAKTTAFDLQVNPAHPSLQFYKLDRAKDRRFCSVRANLDLRLIAHRSEDGLLLCYVGHHDDSYDWAERRKLEVHPKTGAAQSAFARARIPFKVLDGTVETSGGYASLGTMELAKGLEHRTVVVMDCGDEVIPLQERIESVGDEADLAEVYASERQLLYVACTTARDHLLVTGVNPASELSTTCRLSRYLAGQHARLRPAPVLHKRNHTHGI